MNCEIEYRLQNTLNKVKRLIEECEEEGLTNEQYFIAFEDELNKWSVRDHDKIVFNTKYMD